MTAQHLKTRYDHRALQSQLNLIVGTEILKQIKQNPGSAHRNKPGFNAHNITMKTAGCQIMTVFQADQLERVQLSCLDSERALLAEQVRLRDAAREKAKVAASSDAANQ
jgi:hypothetical protein